MRRLAHTDAANYTSDTDLRHRGAGRDHAHPMKLGDYLSPLPLVAVLRGITPEEIPAIADALYGEGFRILEVPLNSPRPFESIRLLAERCGDRCLVGAGTVIDPADVARVRDARGDLIVMPHADTAVIREARHHGMVCLPRVARGVAKKHARVRRRRHPSGQHGALVERGCRGIRHGLQSVQAGCRFCTRSRGRGRVCERVSCADTMTTPRARENHASARFDIVALGEAMIEFNEARAGDSRTWLQGFGGDTSNMAIAAARLGARCAYVTRVGDDDFGRRLVVLWNGEGVSTEGVAIDEDAPTGVYFVSHGEEGHAFSYLRSGSAAS